MKTPSLFSSGRPVFVSLAAALIFSSPAAAQISVSTLTDEDDTPSGAQISLREALRDSADGGQITLDASLAGGALVLTKDELVVTGKTVSIAAPDGLVIDGHQRSRIFSVGSGAGLNLTGLTLQYGLPESGGGGAILSSGTLTLTDCVLRDNRAAYGVSGAAGITGVIIPNIGANGTNGGHGTPGSDGGAIHNTGSLSALRCHFIDNFAGAGGHGGRGGDASQGYPYVRPGRPGNGGQGGSGGAILNTGPLQLTGCVFSGNGSGAGGGGGGGGFPTQRSCGSNGGNSGDGGAVLQNGNLSVERCTFYKNTCPSGGGGYPGDPFGSGCPAGIGGQSGSGGAISCEGGGAVLTNSTFVANIVGDSGGTPAPGGTIRGGSQLRLVHSTVTGNLATWDSAPLPGFTFRYASLTSGVAGAPQCENCIVSGNTLNSTQEINFSPGSQPVLIPANSPGTTVGVNLQLSPLSITSGPLPVLVPGAASPALNAGAVLNDPPATDQRGLPRAAGAPDLGAAEVQETEPALRALQSITFSPPQIALTTTVTLSASASSSLPVSLELIAGPATLNGNTLTFTGSPGFAVVRASQPGDAATAAAMPVIGFIEAPPNHTISFTPAANYRVYNGSPTLVVLPRLTSAGLPVTWTFAGTVDPGFSLDGNTVTATAAGIVQVRGRFPGNAQYSGLNFTWSLTFVAGAAAWNYPQGTPASVFTFVEGSPHGMTMKASIAAPHTSPLPVPALPGGLVASPDVIPAGQTSVDCLITLPANPQLVSHSITVVPGVAFPSVRFCLVNRTAVPLDVPAPASMVSGVSGQVDVSCPSPLFIIPEFCATVNLGVRTITVSAVDFDHPATSVPVTLNSVTNGPGENPKKLLLITFPPMDRRVKLTVTTDDGITGQSGPIQVISDTNTDGDGINDLIETALQRPAGQRDSPPLTIERDAAGLHAVLASRPINLQGWTVVIEQSTDLNTWTPAPAASTTVTPNPDGLTQRVSVLLSAGAEPHFVRLKATSPQ